MKAAIFIDRDGTFIEEVGYLKMLEDLRFTPRAVQALEIFRQLGFMSIVITNQSAIARGILSPKELNKIHQKMRTLAKEEGGTIDDIIYCPHFPEGRIAPFNINCDCRKPKPGMVLHAAQKHHLDLTRCIVVGDKQTDLELAKNTGTRGVLVMTGYGSQTREQVKDIECYANLFEFAQALKTECEAHIPPSEPQTAPQENST